MNPDDVDQELVDVFTAAWEAKRNEIGRGIPPKGTKVRAGLAAVLDVLESRKPAVEEVSDIITFDMVLGGVDYAQAPLPVEKIEGEGPRAGAP